MGRILFKECVALIFDITTLVNGRRTYSETYYISQIGDNYTFQMESIIGVCQIGKEALD